MSRSEMYHVGIVVPDLEAGQAHFTELLGTVWGPIVASDLEVRDGDGIDSVASIRSCYSTAAPYLELIEETHGTTWVCNAYSNLHHIGFYSDDLGADSASLALTRCPLELCGRDGTSGPAVFTYHRDPLGVRIEYVDAAMRPTMEEFILRPAGDA